MCALWIPARSGVSLKEWSQKRSCCSPSSGFRSEKRLQRGPSTCPPRRENLYTRVKPASNRCVPSRYLQDLRIPCHCDLRNSCAVVPVLGFDQRKDCNIALVRVHLVGKVVDTAGNPASIGCVIVEALRSAPVKQQVTDVLAVCVASVLRVAFRCRI